MKFLILIPAAILFAVVLQDAFEVMLLPRRVMRRFRLMRLYYRATWAAWVKLARRIEPPLRREHFIGVYGPLSILLLFAIWATGLIVSFGIFSWVAQPAGEASALSEQIYMSGVTFFTLGYGDVVPHSGAARFVSVVEAGAGIGFIAIVIGYLPVLYQLFSRREAHVIQLDARAGTPPTATTLLCRHAEAGALAKLDDMLREWEVWASELLESHLSYPMLAFYRSQHEDQSWLGALTAIMDTCAIILVGVEGVPPLQARMTFMMARLVVVDMARGFGAAPSRYDGGDRLTRDGYLAMEASFAEAGLEWAGGPETEATLATLRATYEPLLDGLARYLMHPLPMLVPDERNSDHWDRGHRGLIARRLVEELSSRSSSTATSVNGSRAGGWRTVRQRLTRD